MTIINMTVMQYDSYDSYDSYAVMQCDNYGICHLCDMTFMQYDSDAT